MSNPKTVDSSLWWDSFTSTITELENASLSSDLPPHLAKKLKENHAWFVDTVSLFKQPNAMSREALNSEKLKIGRHELTIKIEFKDKALEVSSYLSLDEVQSYILVERSLERVELPIDSMVEEYLPVVLLYYNIERQCLLKCCRRILMHALYVGISSKEENVVKDEALKLISDGLEHKLISVLQDLLSSAHPEQMDVDLFTLWAEETVIEDNLVLDILFLIYYESLCSCNGETWKKLCSLYKGILSGSCNFGKLAVSTEALKCSHHAKIQLLLILIETLDLENLLQLMHDEVPFRQGTSMFSITDIQQMDAMVSSFTTFEMREAGPLILTWAVCLCLISSLPGKEENNVLMEIDHVSYVRQAFEGASLSYFVEILESDMLKESDGPVSGYRSVLRTFISAFIASYEINLQLEDSTLKLILDILCKIYRGEESLCIQFWDRESFIDGPIRCLLCNLEGEFPFRTAEFVRLLSSLSEGCWPAECVYNFLDKSVGISSLFEITSESLVDGISQVVETKQPLHVPGVESLLIPVKTRGHILKVIGGNTALVRWEHKQSGVLILLLHLAHELHLECNEEVFLTFDLLNRMVSFNAAISFSLMGIDDSFYRQAGGIYEQMEKNFWVAEIICAVIKKLSSNSGGAAVMSMGVSILAKMLRCSPCHIAATALKANIFETAWKASVFEVGYDGSLSGSWLLSGKLAQMLLVDCEQNDYDNPLTISVLDFTMQLVEARIENDLVLALVVFSLQYILVNHEYWKYKVKHVRWKVTLKALEVMKTCIASIPFSEKWGMIVRDILLNDSSIHSALFHLICTTRQTLENLYISRLFELKEIEAFQLAIDSALNILHLMLSKFCKDISPSLPVFHQAVLSSSTKPVPVVAAVISLISYSSNPAIQVGAARVLSLLFSTADYLQTYLSGNVFFGLDDSQITDLRDSVKSTLAKQPDWNEHLFVATANLLTSAARFQPAYLVAIFSLKEDAEVHLSSSGGLKQPPNEHSNGSPCYKKSCLLDAVTQYIERSSDFINRNPRILFTMLDFLKALWQGAVQYLSILECLKSSGKFWKHLSNCISVVASLKASPFENLTEMQSQSLAFKYQCQSAALEIMSHEMFLKKKLLHAECLLKEASESIERNEIAVSIENSKVADDFDLMDVLVDWCKRSIFEDVIKLYTCCEYDNDICYRAKLSASLFIVHAMGKLATGNAGSLSVSLLEKIRVTFKHLSCQLAFSELVSQYSQRGYSEGKELNSLILNDLYYHLQGELEGRKIGPGPFKELSQYLVESNCLQSYQHKHGDEHYADAEDVHLYDLMRIRADLGLDLWDYTDWKASKATAKIMLDCLEKANSMVILARSKLSALNSLLTFLAVYLGNSTEKKDSIEGKIPDQLCFSCIDHICKCLHTTVELLAPFLDASEEIFNFLAAQAELLLLLMRSVKSSLSSSVGILVLKTSGSGLRMLGNFSSSVNGVKKITKLLLMLLLSALEFSKSSDKESEDLSEVSNVCLGILPILCNCIATSEEHCGLSLTTIDLILRSFLTPNTWFPIIQKHLQLLHVILKLQDKNSVTSVTIILQFLLTLARVRGGAEMLLRAGFFSSLRALFAELSDVRPSTIMINDNSFLKSENAEKPQPIWGLGLAVVVAMVHSLGDSSYTDIVDNVIPYLFSEKAHLISYYINAPDFPSDTQDKKRPRAQRTQASLTALQETEHTLMLMCSLAKRWSSWVKAMKEMDSQLREKSIHLLAFISRGTHRLGESSSRTAPISCPPILKEEAECFKKPSFVNSKNGWFALSPICCTSELRSSAVSVNSTAIIVQGQSAEITDPISATYFSDLVALQIYRIAFLLLKFLCLEAEGAVKRSEEVGFVDLAHIPELPMPEILHGLQDQAVAIVSELCEANRLKHVHPEIQSICLLLLQIMEMALYLELCVLQICGIRPVLGRVEDFSKEVKILLKAMGGHAFLKASVTSLKQIISLVYPGLLQTEGFM